MRSFLLISITIMVFMISPICPTKSGIADYAKLFKIHHDMMFFINTYCKDSGMGQLSGKEKLLVRTSEQMASEACKDFIGIKPLTSMKMLVFVVVLNTPITPRLTATLHIADSSGANPQTLQYEQAFSCDLRTKVITINPLTGVFSSAKITPDDSTNLFNTDQPEYTQCVVIMECDVHCGPNGIQKFDEKYWQLQIDNTDLIKGNADQSFLSKLRCEAENLQTPETIEVNEQKVERIRDLAIDSLYDTGLKPCIPPYFMFYTENGGAKIKTDKIECKSSVPDPAKPKEKKYQYVAMENNKPDRPIAIGTNVSAICSQKKCRMCATLELADGEKHCPNSKCTTFSKPEQDTQDLDKCNFLKINCPVMSIVNDIIGGKLNKIAQCDEDTLTYVLVDKDGKKTSIDKKTICFDKYDPKEKPLAIPTKEKIAELNAKIANNHKVDVDTNMRDCESAAGCSCETIKDEKKYRLAILNKQENEWRRVDSVTFDYLLNTWSFDRTVKKDKADINIHGSAENRSIVCVAALTKPANLPNSGSSMVYIVSILILLLSAIISTIVVIVFVNARVKAREAHKAKKDNEKKKKSEDKTDKKDDEKKEAEKKSEA